MPAFSVGVPKVKSLFKSIKLSATDSMLVLMIVCVPLTVKLPVRITSPDIVPPVELNLVFAMPKAALA